MYLFQCLCLGPTGGRHNVLLFHRTAVTICYYFHRHNVLVFPVQELAIFHQDYPHSCALQHEAFILKELDAMPPDEFRTELRDSLTTFYVNIFKKSGAGGRPAAKPLSRKVVTKTASVPDPPVVPCPYPPTTPTPTQSSPPPTPRLPPLHRHRPLLMKQH